MDTRLLLSLVLMGLVLFASQYFLGTFNPPPQKKSEVAKSVSPPPATPPASPVAEPATPLPSDVAASAQDDNIVVETNLYRVRFSNRGAVVLSWVLKQYKDQNRKPVELVNRAGGEKLGFPFSVVAKGVQLAVDPNQALFVVRKSSDGLSLEFEYASAGVVARKSFQFEPHRYVVQISSELRQDKRLVPHLVQWRGGFGDFTAVNPLSTQHALYFDTAENSLEVKTADDAKKGTLTVSGKFHFAGIEDTYFTAVALPAANASWEVHTFADWVHFPPSGKDELHVGVALGGEGLNRSPVFVGPKDIDILKSVDPKLEQVVDFGWFWFLAKPLFAVLHALNDRYIHNYGWSIIIVTILINILLLPLKISSLKSMKKMAELQPQIKAIQEKYAHLKFNDPRRQEQQAETMALYNKHGVNPLGGCLPMALPIPFLFAFYKVLTVAIELRGASWLWVPDLSQPETLSLRVLPLATIATQFQLQNMTPSTGLDPAQQRIMKLMPLMFIFLFWNVASGLVLYWLTGNVIAIVQQWFFNRTISKPAPVLAPAAAAAPKKKR
ncbi:MAG: membrane protein insertase YidC [Bryobacteraceae bacterium]|nr:membrane protein insertase YidC [Bryobacteraceae bacterium]MDW8378271.1 membrane protein insertase YidC [Bryobacterales bacterium]